MTRTLVTTPPHPTDAGATSSRGVVVTLAVIGIHRVELRGGTIGYIEEVGPCFVALLGSMYNTAVEVAQAHAFDDAVRRLLSARD